MKRLADPWCVAANDALRAKIDANRTHGAAHGVEAPAGAGLSYVVGFLVTTAGLHVAGLAGAGLLL